MAVKYLAGERLVGTAAERTALETTALTAIPQTSWKELGRTKLTSSGSTCTVTGLASKDNLMILRHTIGGDTAIGSYLRVGNGSIDSGSNYADRSSYSGASDATSVSQTALKFQHSFGVYTTGFDVTYVRNIATKEKPFTNHYVYQRADGANAPERGEAIGKWANTSNVIDQVQMLNDSGDTGAFQTGTELVVLGCDDDEADTGTNFWQELSNTDLSAGAANNINSGTITAKKYLMVDCRITPASSNAGNTNIIVNSDTAQANYSMRRSYDGANEYTAAGSNPTGSSNGMYTGFGENQQAVSMNMMIANVSGEEKLMIWHMLHTYDGDTDQPHRTEGVGKWQTTSGQITNFKIYTSANGNAYGTATIMRVWGSD